ncbi:MAG: phage tail tape measure protein [Proteobacteria bacterium]|jgi:TP901 family phage tail tape measure protein|nr:phage tail tape measure protein [Pseudomonadota bacterium]
MATPDTNNMNKVRDALMMVGVSMKGTKINAQELLTELNKYNEIFSIMKLRVSDASATIKVMNQDMETLSATFKMVKGDLSVSTVMDSNVAATNRLKAAIIELHNEERRFQRNVPRMGGLIGVDESTLGRANTQDFGNYQQASQNLAQSMAKNKIYMDDVRGMLASMSSNTAMGPMNQGVKEVYTALQQVVRTWDTINNKEKAATAEIQNQAQSIRNNAYDAAIRQREQENVMYRTRDTDINSTKNAAYKEKEINDEKRLADEIRLGTAAIRSAEAAKEQKSKHSASLIREEILAERSLRIENEKKLAVQRLAQTNMVGIGAELGFDKSVIGKSSFADYTKLQVAQNQLAQTMTNNGVSMIQLNNMWKSMVTRSPMGAMNKETQEVYTQLQKLASVYAGMDSNFAKTFDIIGKGANDAKKKITEFSVSWQLALKLVAVQLAHQSISAFIRELQAGALYAIEVQKRIAEVRTISQADQLTNPQWLKGFTNVSNKYGIDLLDQIAGGYEAISNQVVKGTETFKFMEEASKFAVTAVTTTKDAVNLLSTAINAYGLSVADSERISSIFFKTIEVGRIRGEEMANMGQLVVPAEQLGITLEELGALVATLTIRGMKASETFTQIRGIFTALLRPTEEMTRFFKEMGVASGEQMLASYGLVGTFEALRTRTQGYSSELSALIPRVRGIAGAVALTGSALETYKQSWYDIGHGTEYYRNAVSLAMESSGRKIQIEIEKVKNYFRTELGSEALGYVVSLSEQVGGLDRLLKGLTTTVAGLVPLMAGLGTFAAYRLAQGHPFAIILSGLFSMYKTVMEFNRYNIMAAQEFTDNWQEAFKDMSKAHAEEVNKMALGISSGLAEYSNRINNVVTELTLESNKMLKGYTDNYLESFKLIETEHDNMMTVLNASINDTKKRASDAKSMAEKLDNKMISSDINKDKLMYDWFSNEQETPQDKLKVLLEHIEELKSEQVELYSSENLDRALEVSDEIIEFEKQVYQYSTQIRKENERNARATEDLLRRRANKEAEYRNDKQTMEARWYQLQAEKEDVQFKHSKSGKKELRKIAEDEIKLRGQYNELVLKHKQEEEEIEIKLKRKEQHVLTYLDCVKRVNKAYEEQNRLLKEAQNVQVIDNVILEAKTQEAEFKKNDIENTIQSIKKFNLKSVLGEKDDATVRKDLEEQIRLIERYQELSGKTVTTDKMKTGINDILLEEMRSREDQKNLRTTEQDRQESESKIKGMTTLLNQVTQSNEEVKLVLGNTARLALSGIPSTYLNKYDYLVNMGLDYMSQFTEESKMLGDAIDTFTKTSSSKDSINVLTRVNQLISDTENITSKLNEPGAPVSPEALKVMSDYLSELKQIKQIFSSGFMTNLKDQETMEDEIKREERNMVRIGDLQSRYANAANTALDKFMVMVKEMDILLNNMDSRLSGLQNRLPVDSSASTISPRAFGGMTHGTDSVKALLTPGEFVVNANASRRFYSQLVAMNAGPRHFASGGPVTSINGDFNISMNSSGNEHIDVVKIGKLLRREVRRGTVVLH